MIGNLWLRLLAAFALVIVITISAVFFFTYQTTRNEIKRFGEHVEQVRSRGLEFELSDMISLDAGAMFNITEDTFAGLLIGVRILL